MSCMAPPQRDVPATGAMARMPRPAGPDRRIRAKRAETLDAAYAANPARFCHRRPTPPKLPTVAWMNKPSPEALIQSA